MVTIVLLNVALMCAMPRLTLRLCLRFLLLATVVCPLAVHLVSAARSASKDRPCWRCGLRKVGKHRFLAPHFLHALLARHRLPRPLARPGVGPRPLAVDRQAAAVPQPAVALNLLQARDVLVHLAAQRPFDR